MCLSASPRVMILLGVKFFYYFSCLYSFLFQKLNPAYIRKLPKEFVIEKLFLLDPFTDLLFGMFCIAHYCFLCPVDFVHIPLKTSRSALASLLVS